MTTFPAFTRHDTKIDSIEYVDELVGPKWRADPMGCAFDSPFWLVKTFHPFVARCDKKAKCLNKLQNVARPMLEQKWKEAGPDAVNATRNDMQAAWKEMTGAKEEGNFEAVIPIWMALTAGLPLTCWHIRVYQKCLCKKTMGERRQQELLTAHDSTLAARVDTNQAKLPEILNGRFGNSMAGKLCEDDCGKDKMKQTVVDDRLPPVLSVEHVSWNSLTYDDVKFRYYNVQLQRVDVVYRVRGLIICHRQHYMAARILNSMAETMEAVWYDGQVNDGRPTLLRAGELATKLSQYQKDGELSLVVLERVL